MVKKFPAQRSEADRAADDENDPVIKMLDDEGMSMQEIFDVLGWEPVPAELFETKPKLR